MNAKEMRDMPDDELAEQVGTLRKDLFGLRFANATGEVLRQNTAGVGSRPARPRTRAHRAARAGTWDVTRWPMTNRTTR